MAEILTFRPRPRLTTADRLVPQQRLVTVPRADLEEAAHATLDAAEKLIAVLDALDGDPDLEPSTDDEPSLRTRGSSRQQHRVVSRDRPRH